ncbi:hypothetical protein ABPG75_011340 [Micractinium tetrahymenae]
MQLQIPRSPRPHWADELQPPPAARLHGKQWHCGDPHSRYRFLRVLGTGHYGVTYLCTSLRTGQHVAIKALDKLHPEYERDLAIEEILILAAVSDHPNVVDMHEVWEDASYLYIVMEACMGGELFDMVIERKHFTEADAASITAAILSVMQHCHSKGIIHRDLKPENFLLSREGELSADNLRAIDFGLSKFVEGDGICRSCVGSSYYVAPEVLRGAYSYEADAWSVGTICYILLSGFPPFWGSSDQVIFHRILSRPVDFDYQPWHQISAAAKDFVGRLLEKDPAKRMSVSEGLTHPWITEQAADVPLSTEIISRLQSFTHQNRVKCLLMTIAAHHLSDDQIGGLRKIFHFIDADHDGEISMHDLTVALQHTGLDMEQQGVVSLLAGLDLAHHGTVHVEEFIAAALDQRKVLNAKTVSAIFTRLDRDHDGLITVQQLKDALEECNISIKAETLGRLMDREGALDSKGMVSAKSFAELLMNGQSARPLELETWMQDVHEFSAASSFKQLAMLVVARHMQPAEVESLRQLFQQLDEEATGTISMRQLQEAMRHMGQEVGEAELRALLQALDVRRHGVIEYDEFLAACLEEQHLTEQHLRAAFDFFDHDGSGDITESDVVQVLKEVGMDASVADELMAAASGPLSETSPASSRSISYDDFRRMLVTQPVGIITKALSRANSMSRPSTGSRGSSLSVSRSSSGQLDSAPPPGVPAHPRLEAALASIKRSPAAAGGLAPATAAVGAAAAAAGQWMAAPGGADAARAAQAGGVATAARPSPQQGPDRPLGSGLGSHRLVLPPAGNDFEPDFSDYEDSPHPGSGGDGRGSGSSTQAAYPGLQPPSPISLMPRFDPSSPTIDLRPRHEPPSPIDLRPRYEPPSPISLSLAPRQEPPSPGGQLSSPPQRPYAGFGRASSLGSPTISLAPLHAPPSPAASLGSPGSVGRRSADGGGGGLTLQQILQQYSSSGYSQLRPGTASRRTSMEVPRGEEGAINRDSTISQISDVDETWLGSN